MFSERLIQLTFEAIVILNHKKLTQKLIMQVQWDTPKPQRLCRWLCSTSQKAVPQHTSNGAKICLVVFMSFVCHVSWVGISVPLVHFSVRKEDLLFYFLFAYVIQWFFYFEPIYLLSTPSWFPELQKFLTDLELKSVRIFWRLTFKPTGPRVS